MASKTKDPKWLTMAEALLKELPSRPDDADPQVERLDWRLQEQMDRIVAAARLKPEGVKPAQCRDWPQVIEDAPVAAWWTQRRLAALYGVDERTVQRWESRGLPNFGAGPTKRYPIPQATVW